MPGASDVATHVAGLAYSYTHGPHTLGVEADYIDRDASIVGDTESYRVGMFWRVAFDKPAVRRSPSGAASPAPAAVPAPTGSLALADLVPGMFVAAATRRIDAAVSPTPWSGSCRPSLTCSGASAWPWCSGTGGSTSWR